MSINHEKCQDGVRPAEAGGRVGGEGMKVLIACEFSGIVRDAFIAKGHDAWSCDLLPTERLGPHIQGDVLAILNDGWEMMIAHPPCTYLANSGVQHLHKDKTRWDKMRDGRVFFMKLWLANIPKIAIENPTPHHFADLPPYSQAIQPWMFGNKAMKRTCLWLKNLPPLFCTEWVEEGEKYIMSNGKCKGAKWYQLLPTENRGHERSRTFQGIADAMASQWGVRP